MNPENYSSLKSRRAFIRQAACAAVGTAALSNTIRDLRFINAAIAQSSVTGYKALICVFLNGGNDANNLIIPTNPSEWASYANVRTPTLAIPNADGGPATAQALASLNGQPGFPAVDGRSYGFHPAMIELARSFNQTNTPPYNLAKVAAMLNVGTLSYPLTKAQYQSGSVPKPPQLFSHSDQQVQWQTSIPDRPPISGWGGRIADLLTTPTDVNAGGYVSMAITLAGSNKFEVGDINAAAQYSVTTSGAVNISGVTGARLATLQSIMNTDKALPDYQTGAYGKVLDHAVAEAGLVNNALAASATDALAPWRLYFPTNVTTPNGGSTFQSSLMSQMKMVARLIDAGKRNYTGNVSGTGLGMKRQIFFVQVGGYDTHSGQTDNAAGTDPSKVILGQQANLLAELSQSLNALMKAMTDLGMVNEVTAFTVSDFARTFPANSAGSSDHGWGGHQIVVGGAVKGGATYGRLPALTVNGPDDTGTGRWIPTMAVDQYAAELASWFGVDNSNLATIFPNLNRFGRMSVPFI